MKPNEIMLDDLLNTSKGIGKVVAIDGEGITFKGKEGNYFDISHANDVGGNWYEPIPLTPEIPEKNGFTKCDTDEDGSIQYEFGESNLGIDIWLNTEPALLGAWRQWDDYNEPYSMVNELPINYVHELQHALKLCGIDKEIIL